MCWLWDPTWSLGYCYVFAMVFHEVAKGLALWLLWYSSWLLGCCCMVAMAFWVVARVLLCGCSDVAKWLLLYSKESLGCCCVVGRVLVGCCYGISGGCLVVAIVFQMVTVRLFQEIPIRVVFF